MGKNSCSIIEAGQPRDDLLRKTVELFVGVWSGSEPGALNAVAKPAPGPVLHRLPDLRKFGPSIPR
jgi:hypothetical protein